jgi:outer membrane lipopolysaccharide assembly protein LptE/RlpB
MKRAAVAAAAWSAALFAAGCGYHVAGRTDVLPKSIRTIAVPAFGNVTMRYKLAERLPKDVAREFITRTRYNVVGEPAKADAVLNGAVVNYFSYPTVVDPITSRATGVEVVVLLQVTLRDSGGKVLFQRNNFEIRERYQISVDPNTYFDESDAALERLSRDVARSIVSAVLENF